MGFFEAVTSAFSNYFNFSGRARRSEYWYFALFLFVVGIIAALIDFSISRTLDIGPVNSIFTLATIIPSLSVSVRRLHDIGRTGWFLLLALIPLIGIIVLIYWACQPGTAGPNPYGNPVA
jgi:uncharacterized membrane protein YhaH (DUF805 family)